MITRDSRISPWVRPALLGAVAFMALGVALISGIIDGFAPGYGARFGLGVMTVAAQTPDNLYETFQWMFAIYGLGKSGEKIMKNYRAAAAPQGEEI